MAKVDKKSYIPITLLKVLPLKYGYNIPFVLSCNSIEVVSGAAVHYRASNADSLSNSTSQLKLIKG